MDVLSRISVNAPFHVRIVHDLLVRCHKQASYTRAVATMI